AIAAQEAGEHNPGGRARAPGAAEGARGCRRRARHPRGAAHSPQRGAGPPLREDQAPAEYVAEGRDPVRGAAQGGDEAPLPNPRLQGGSWTREATGHQRGGPEARDPLPKQNAAAR
ncbi:unnamed protein product, partial [Symbiodinium microadriaticum]